jgi:hypothetical protein
MRAIVLSWFLLIYQLTAWSQQMGDDQDQNFILQIIKGKDSAVDHVIANSGKYHFQILLSLVQFQDGKEELIDFDFNKDRYYFSPASLIKLPVMIISGEKFSRLMKYQDLSPDDSIAISPCSCDRSTPIYLSKTKPPTFRQLIRETTIMSSNPGYNFFFDFLGKDTFNTRVRELGFTKTNLRKRFYSPCSGTDQSKFGGVSFFDYNGRIKYNLKCNNSYLPWENEMSWPHVAGTYHKENGKWVSGPKDYGDGNYLALSDAHRMMVGLFNPDPNNGSSFQMNKDIRQILITALGDYPRELQSTHYEMNNPDHYYKFFLDPSTMNTEDGQLRIYNKVGIAGGFISDVSFFHDKRTGLKFYLSAAMLAKKDGRMDNGKYNYFDIGIPVFRKIGSFIYEYLSGGAGTDLH